MTSALEDPATSRLVVFSHPNHELTVFGLLQRLRPRIVYLTDGGGEERVEQTRRGLASIGLLEHARFLDHTEASFYEAILNRDAGFFRRVADEVRETVDIVEPQQVFCDAVEFYNPVHDLSLPVVDAALGDERRATVFEVPLIWQRSGGGESYVVQRAPAARARDRVQSHLTEAETTAKIAARDGIYALLAEQMGPLSSSIPRREVALEEVMRRAGGPTLPGGEVALRYEARARALLARGVIARTITFEGHVLPLVRELASAPVR